MTKRRAYQWQKNMNVLYEMTKANFKLQNENSYLGIIWYLLGPALIFCILLFVFSSRLGANVEHYPLYLLMGIISWNFFATGTGRALAVFLQNGGLIKALPIRLDLLVVASVLHAFLSHLIEIIIFILLLCYFGIYPVYFHWYLLIVLLSFFFTLGTGLLLASLFVLVRDIQQIWSVITRAWWFATPIFYVISPTGPGSTLSLFNPLYYSIYLSREFLVYTRIPPLWMIGVFVCMTLMSLIVGYSVFHSLRTKFVDLL